MHTLFEPVQYGSIATSNRFVMAPMSRNRATEQGHATALMATYYGQRASAGLIISEGIQPSQVGQGYMNSPGLHTLQQAKSWLQVTDSVHAQGGKIVAQLMHCGRIGHPSLYPSAHQSVAPSAITAQGQTYTPDGMKDFAPPRALAMDEIQSTISDYVQAARYAIMGGFDGVEIHAGNGFLPHQFLANNTNLRQDNYGGSIENRTRFTLEIVAAVSDAIGADCIGLRISPHNTFNDIAETDSEQLYSALIQALPTELAYLHIMEAACRETSDAIRRLWKGALILNPHNHWEDGPVTPAIADKVLQQDLCDGVSLGALFVANPDLVDRARLNAPLNNMDDSTLYGGGAKGYTDYPTLNEVAQAV
ncbi:alkene reductase [Pseudoalteromonas rubra]|uniref:Alkene reductase n=1 Tax=Pseudoalteromonas rubra TaxID=43658 RepID=A0A5S3WPU8_9GAMM|nr:alkene reductase [Pseudoalteromonas rubra]TMP30410.1 alkene reductase [Pseudoalteromonas rubra]TMP35434.1 alkene reductase [Pseudoalteromonas rubra]